MGESVKRLILLFLILAACTSEEELKIGVALPLTGAWAVGGETIRNGVVIAQEEINAAGGINGKQVKLIIEDIKSSPADSVTAVKKLIEVDGVNALIAGAYSGDALAVAPVAEQAKTVLISPTALTTPLEEAGEWSFKLRESTGVHSDATLKEIAKKGQKLGILAQKYEACDDYINQMNKLYAKYGITVEILERYEPKDTDMRTQLSKLKEADIDAWFACGLYQDLGLVFKQADELQFKKPAFSMVAVENNKLFEIAGDTAEGVVYTSTKWSCENAQSFCKTFREKHKAEPDYRAAFGYDSMKLLAEAMKKGTKPEQIREGLLSIQDYYGASGKTSFDEKGNAQKEVLVKKVKGRKFVVIDY